MWRSLTLDQTWQATRITFKYCIACACVLLCRFFGYLVSTRCVYPQIGRAFEAPIGHKTLLCGHMVLLGPFIAHFLKKNYNLRQNTLKNFRAWERSLTLVPIDVYLCLIEVGTWLGKGSAKELWRFAKKWWSDATPNSASSIRSIHRRWTDAAQEWPNNEQCSSNVWCEDGPTSSQTKKRMIGSTGLYSASGQG